MAIYWQQYTSGLPFINFFIIQFDVAILQMLNILQAKHFKSHKKTTVEYTVFFYEVFPGVINKTLSVI